MKHIGYYVRSVSGRLDIIDVVVEVIVATEGGRFGYVPPDKRPNVLRSARPQFKHSTHPWRLLCGQPKLLGR